MVETCTGVRVRGRVNNRQTKTLDCHTYSNLVQPSTFYTRGIENKVAGERREQIRDLCDWVRNGELRGEALRQAAEGLLSDPQLGPQTLPSELRAKGHYTAIYKAGVKR